MARREGKPGRKAEEPALESELQGVVPHLVELGLTQYEAQVYAALVGNGESKVGLIHTESGVPRPSVYGTLRQLESRGLVDRTAGDPVRFRAVPPAVALRRTREGVDRAAAAALEGLNRLRQTGKPSRSRSLWIAEGKGALAERLPVRLARAKREILVLGHPRAVRRIQGDLDDAAARGVRIVYLDPNGARTRRGGGGRARLGLPSPRTAGESVAGAVDRRAVFYGAWTGRSEEFAWSENPSFVQFALAFLGQLAP